MKMYTAVVEDRYGSEATNYITHAESKDKALEKIKSSMCKTNWGRFEKRITESIGEEDEVFVIHQFWD